MAKFLRLGSIAGEPLLADIGHLGGELAPRFVTLAVDYLVENPGAGFPVRPCFLGANPHPTLPYTIAAGTTVPLFKAEADALIAAGAAVLA